MNAWWKEACCEPDAAIEQQALARDVDDDAALDGGLGLGGVAVLGELGADGGGTTDVGLDLRDITRRRAWGDAEDAFIHPLATEDGGGFRAIGGDLQHAALREESATRALRRDRHFAYLVARDFRQIVKRARPSRRSR